MSERSAAQAAGRRSTIDGSVKSRITHLDGLRGLAILTVFSVHWSRGQAPIFTGGYIGVDIFFVLSGYIITTLLVRRAPTYRSFIVDRVRRLYPPLLGLLVFGTLIVALWPNADISLGQTWRAAAIASLQGTSLWVAAGNQADLEPFVITWSLAVEWYFYLAWPFAVTALARLSRVSAVRVCCASAATLFVVALFMTPEWFYFGPVARFSQLFAGGALAFWTLAGYRAPANRATSILLWCAAVFICGWTLLGTEVFSWTYRAIAFPLVTASAVVLIAAGNGEISRHLVVQILQWRPLVWIGGISYSLYLWHTLPIVLIPGDWYGLPMPVLGVIGLTLVAMTTWLGFILLEQPFRHRRTTELKPGLNDSTTGGPSDV